MEVRSILAAGQDPHVYEIKPNDAALVSRSALCFDNGWHLEGANWMRKLAENANKPITSCTTGATPLEINNGAAHDPHAWFSPANAAVYVRNIRDAVSQYDPTHRDDYHARAQLYLDELRTLDGWIRKQMNAIPVEKRILVTSHDAFNYFCREYHFTAATPVGWSTGSEVGGGVTPERRRETVKSIRSFGVRSIFVETSVSPVMIRQIADEAGVVVGGTLYSDSMGPPGSAGETYIGMMRENVLTIAAGLK
ncbi:ABC transporter solute-binding protein [Blastopirellula marina DSM 3645]|uniref:ABC transporter solute-binding protein n=2 Tax=Blastopirellula marina TaxID=124 RepID=A3ZXI7_9BACT|nr:ABC transporter solute-binding protein [Blastopirellula marina DSM 3645]